MPDLSFSVGTNGDLNYSDRGGAPRFLKSLDQGAQTLAAVAATPLASGNVARQILVFTASLTPAATNANTSAEQSFTVTGLLTSDTLLNVVPPSAPTAGLSGPTQARISAADTLRLTWGNHTGGALTAPAGTYTVIVLR